MNKIKPNWFLENDRYIRDYGKNFGLKLWTKSCILTDRTTQNTNYTIFISFIHDETKTCKVTWSNTVGQLHVKFPPIFAIKSNEISISDRTGEDKTQLTSDFKNKQLFLWLTKSGNTAKMALCNYSGVIFKNWNLHNFIAQQLEIDFNDVYVLRVGYTTNFHDLDAIDYHRIIREEKRNGTYCVNSLT